MSELLRDKSGKTEEEFLKHYQSSDYARPSVATDMVIFTVTEEQEDNYRKLPEKELRVLLIKRGGHPYLGCWALPGGFVRQTETTEEAARRELQEETGVDCAYLEQLYTFSDLGRDPRTWVMSCSYMALIDSDQVTVKGGDDADQAAWFTLNVQIKQESVEKKEGKYIQRKEYHITLSHETNRLHSTVLQTQTKSRTEQNTQYQILSNEGIAFDHSKILICAVERLRGKLEYSDLALYLLPELFTLSQMQQVYEIILNKKLFKAAFRRKIADMVEETEFYTENDGHRPSRLYRRKLE